MRTICLAGLALAAAACAPPAPMGPQASAPAGACFDSDQVSGFREAGPRAFDLFVRGDRAWRVETLGPCRNDGGSLDIALVTPGGAGVVCRPADAELVVPTLSGPRRCPIRTLRPLTPAEASAPAG